MTDLPKDLLFKTIRVKGHTLKVIQYDVKFPENRKYVVEEFRKEVEAGVYDIMTRKVPKNDFPIRQREPVVTVTGIDPERWIDYEKQYLISDKEPYKGKYYTVAQVEEIEAKREGKEYRMPKPITVQFTLRAKVEFLE